MIYYRPIAMTDSLRPTTAQTLAGGWTWFSHAEALSRSGSGRLVPVAEIPPDWMARLAAKRAVIGTVDLGRPALMGVLNVTPDSFSDGGRFVRPEAALAQARQMAADGADIIDVGGESTRPGAAVVSAADETARILPVIGALRAAGIDQPVSVDTRKAAVAAAALSAGANWVNDVAALTYDPALAPLVAATGAPLVLMHAQGTPATMQADPQYDNVLLDVYDWLEARVAAAEAAGIPRSRILVDPGIGFGKTADHNLALLRGLSLFHGLGCGVVLGVSRKRFIGTLGDEPDAERRGPGTIAVTLGALAQGVQVHRVHDIQAARQALRLWSAVQGGDVA